MQSLLDTINASLENNNSAIAEALDASSKMKKSSLESINAALGLQIKAEVMVEETTGKVIEMSQTQKAQINEARRTAIGYLFWNKVPVAQLKDNSNEKDLKAVLKAVVEGNLAARYPVETLPETFIPWKQRNNKNAKPVKVNKDKPQWGSMPLTQPEKDQATQLANDIAKFGWDNIHLGSGKFASRKVVQTWMIGEDGTVLKTKEEQEAAGLSGDTESRGQVTPMTAKQKAEKNYKSLLNSLKKLDITDAGDAKYLQQISFDLNAEVQQIIAKLEKAAEKAAAEAAAKAA